MRGRRRRVLLKNWLGTGMRTTAAGVGRAWRDVRILAVYRHSLMDTTWQIGMEVKRSAMMW